jgi:hypothetical protein
MRKKVEEMDRIRRNQRQIGGGRESIERKAEKLFRNNSNNRTQSKVKGKGAGMGNW